MELKICHLYPDVLNMDSGNISCLKKRLEWRGIAVSVTKLHVGDGRSLNGFDLVYIGGGQVSGQQALADELRRGRAEDIRRAVENGQVILAIDAGFELLGRYYEEPDGKRRELTGALDMYTVEGRERLTGDYIFSCPETGTDIVAFENHAGRTWLGAGLSPLGRVIKGGGNTGTGGDGGAGGDGVNGGEGGNGGTGGAEGARYKNVFCSYGHGPLLPKNPELADLIIRTALERKYGPVSLKALDDSLELKARKMMTERLGK